MIFAVTGGSGFVGRYLVKKLLSQGVRVGVFTRDKSKFLLNLSQLEVIE
jgi:nucleoside-diphosphate-sugar epimerase